jgi:hypothetical protein
VTPGRDRSPCPRNDTVSSATSGLPCRTRSSLPSRDTVMACSSGSDAAPNPRLGESGRRRHGALGQMGDPSRPDGPVRPGCPEGVGIAHRASSEIRDHRVQFPVHDRAVTEKDQYVEAVGVGERWLVGGRVRGSCESLWHGWIASGAGYGVVGWFPVGAIRLASGAGVGLKNLSTATDSLPTSASRESVTRCGEDCRPTRGRH